MSAFRQAFIFVQGEFAGVLQETDDGYQFTYDADYINRGGLAVSLTLPLSDAPYHSKTLFSFFDGLIPEGWLLGVVASNWKIETDDRFGLLLAACQDCIGDVSVREVMP